MPARARERAFAEERADPSANIFEEAVKHIGAVRAARRKIVIAGWTEGSLERLSQILEEHHLGNLKRVATLAEVENLEAGQAGLAVLPLEAGFRDAKNSSFSPNRTFLGDRLVRRSKKSASGRPISSLKLLPCRRATSSSMPTTASAASSACAPSRRSAPRMTALEIHYADEARLFLPVENIELLSRFGSDSAEVALDRLGGGAWQSRKAKLKRRLLEMAGQLIPPRCRASDARGACFSIRRKDSMASSRRASPYEETDDQQNAIDAVIDDLGAGKPMDRLICGDVGFRQDRGGAARRLRRGDGGVPGRRRGVPTTRFWRASISRPFSERFSGLPIKIRQASRLVGAKELAETKKGIAEGTVDIVVGTHALLGSSISFKSLGLLIIDEEQHFGVKHKERLKDLKSDVHVLTLVGDADPAHAAAGPDRGCANCR